MKIPDSHKSGPTDPEDETTLRRLEDWIDSSRYRQSERLTALLEAVRTEVLFETERVARWNGHPENTAKKNGRREPERSERP